MTTCQCGARCRCRFDSRGEQKTNAAGTPAFATALQILKAFAEEMAGEDGMGATPNRLKARAALEAAAKAPGLADDPGLQRLTRHSLSFAHFRGMDDGQTVAHILRAIDAYQRGGK